MPTWNPDQYLTFADQRSRPYADLLQRVPPTVEPTQIIDLGCGPGHLTEQLLTRWPTAKVTGVDSSADMINRATTEHQHPNASYLQADLVDWVPECSAELIISNATFQWIDNDLDVISRYAETVPVGGCFAISVPNNFHAPSHQLLHDISSTPPYARHTEGLHNARGRDPQQWIELFATAGWQVDAWSTTYQHILPGEDPVLDWISGTGARPILQALPEPLRTEFRRTYGAALHQAYPQRSYGTVLGFERTFCVAVRHEGTLAD